MFVKDSRIPTRSFRNQTIQVLQLRIFFFLQISTQQSSVVLLVAMFCAGHYVVLTCVTLLTMAEIQITRDELNKVRDTNCLQTVTDIYPRVRIVLISTNEDLLRTAFLCVLNFSLSSSQLNS